MLSILRTELFRLKKSTMFWVMLGVCFGLPILGLFIILVSVSAVKNAQTTVNIWEVLKEMGVMETSLSEYASLLSDYTLLSIICSAIFLSKEFSDGTVRNVLLANKKRGELYFSYMLIALLIGTAFLTASFLSLMIFYAPVFGFGALSSGEAATACLCSYALGLVSVLFCQTCVTMFLFAVRKQGATIAFPLLICIFAPVLMEILYGVYVASQAIVGNMPSETLASWLPFLNATLYKANSIDGGLVGKIMLYYLIFTGIFVGAGYGAFSKADLK